MNITKEQIENLEDLTILNAENCKLNNPVVRVVHIPDYLGNDRVEVTIAWTPVSNKELT